MKFKSKNKQHSVKKSSGGQSKELLKTLQKMILEESGSISYVFEDTRYNNIHANIPKNIEEYKVKSTLHVNLSKQAFVNKSPNDLIHMFETTKSDLGAKYFIVN